VRLVNYWLVAFDLQLDQFIVGPLCRFVGIGEGAERYDLEQAETKRGDAPSLSVSMVVLKRQDSFVRITWRDGKLFDDRADVAIRLRAQVAELRRGTLW
jgi:hypothetical protein